MVERFNDVIDPSLQAEIDLEQFPIIVQLTLENSGETLAEHDNNLFSLVVGSLDYSKTNLDGEDSFARAFINEVIELGNQSDEQYAALNPVEKFRSIGIELEQRANSRSLEAKRFWIPILNDMHEKAETQLGWGKLERLEALDGQTLTSN